jgi:hypothetical protein
VVLAAFVKKGQVRAAPARRRERPGARPQGDFCAATTRPAPGEGPQAVGVLRSTRRLKPLLIAVTQEHRTPRAQRAPRRATSRRAKWTVTLPPSIEMRGAPRLYSRAMPLPPGIVVQRLARRLAAHVTQFWQRRTNVWREGAGKGLLERKSRPQIRPNQITAENCDMTIFFSLLPSTAVSCCPPGSVWHPPNRAHRPRFRACFPPYRCVTDSEISNINPVISMRHASFCHLGKHQGSSRDLKIAPNCPVKSIACSRLTTAGGCGFCLMNSISYLQKSSFWGGREPFRPQLESGQESPPAGRRPDP